MFNFPSASELEELKKEIDTTQEWLRQLSDGELQFIKPYYDFFKFVIPFVQNKFRYCTYTMNEDLKKKTFPSKVSARLSAEFFLQTQRILGNMAKANDPEKELQGELAMSNYHFEYDGAGYFHFVIDTKEGRKQVGTINLIVAFAHLGDWFERLKEIVPIEMREQQQDESTIDEPLFQMLLQVYLNNWLREKIDPYEEEEAQSKEIKTNQSTQQIIPFIDFFADSADFQKVIKILDECELLNEDKSFNEKWGNKLAIPFLIDILQQKGYMRKGFKKESRDNIAESFNEQFKCSITGRYLKRDINEYHDYYKLLNRKIVDKKTLTHPFHQTR